MTVEHHAAPPTGPMSQVTVTINGRKFRLACEGGQDRRIGELRTRFGEIGDARLMIMAALMIADELAESSAKLCKAEDELASLQQARVASAEHAKATQAAISAALNSAAERIEGLTKRLNQTIPEVNAALR
jgi:cell division protein ZapA